MGFVFSHPFDVRLVSDFGCKLDAHSRFLIEAAVLESRVTPSLVPKREINQDCGLGHFQGSPSNRFASHGDAVVGWWSHRSERAKYCGGARRTQKPAIPKAGRGWSNVVTAIPGRVAELPQGTTRDGCEVRRSCPTGPPRSENESGNASLRFCVGLVCHDNPPGRGKCLVKREPTGNRNELCSELK